MVKKKEFNKELDNIKRMHSINDVLNKGNMENLLLYSATKEGDAINDTVMESMLHELEQDKNIDKNIHVVESILDKDNNVIIKEKHLSIKGQKSKSINRSMHISKSKSKQHIQLKSSHKKASNKKSKIRR